MHDDGLGCSDPALDLWNSNIGVTASLIVLHNTESVVTLSTLGEVLIHVLSKVSEEGELLVQGPGHRAAGHAGQVVTLAKLDKSEKLSQ